MGSYFATFLLQYVIKIPYSPLPTAGKHTTVCWEQICVIHSRQMLFFNRNQLYFKYQCLARAYQWSSPSLPIA